MEGHVFVSLNFIIYLIILILIIFNLSTESVLIDILRFKKDR